MGNMFDFADSDYYSFLALVAKIRLLCFYAAFVVAGQVLRWFVLKNVPRKYQSSADDCVTTFSVYGCTMANNYVYRVYGQSTHLLVMAAVGIGHALLFGRDATTANPLTHVMSIVCCRKNVLERLVTRFAGHILGGLLCHPVATTFWQVLIGDYCSRRTELVMHCVADEMSSGEPIETTISMILEFIGTLVVCWAATNWRQPVDVCEVVVKVIFGSVLLCSDMKSAGVFFNPVMSNSLQFGCQGDFGQHLVVYWLVPIVAAVFFSFVFCATPKRMATCGLCSSDRSQPCSSRDGPRRRTLFAPDCPCAAADKEDCAAGEGAAASCSPVGREITARVQQVEAKGGEKQLAYVFDIPPTVCKKGLRLKHNILLSKKSKPGKKVCGVDYCRDSYTGRSPWRRRLKSDQLYGGEYLDDGRYEGCCYADRLYRRDLRPSYPSMALCDRKSSSLSKSLSYRSSRDSSAAEMPGEFDDMVLNQGQLPDNMQNVRQSDQRLSRASTSKRDSYKQPTTEMRYSQQRASYPKPSLQPAQEIRQSYRPSEGVRQSFDPTYDAKQSLRPSEFARKSYSPSVGARLSDDQIDDGRQSSRLSGVRKSSIPSGARESYRPSDGMRQSEGPSDDGRQSSRLSGVRKSSIPPGARESYRPSDGLRPSDGPPEDVIQSSRPSGARESYRPSEGVRQGDDLSDDQRRISGLPEDARESYSPPEDARQIPRQSEGARQSYRPSGDLRRSSDQSQSVRPSADLRQSRLSSAAARPSQRRSIESQPYADQNQGNGIPPASSPYPEQRGSLNQSSNSLLRPSRVSALRGSVVPGLQSIATEGNGIPPAPIPYPEQRGSLNQSSNSLLRPSRVSALRGSVVPGLQSIASSGAEVNGMTPAEVDTGMQRPTMTEFERKQSTQNNGIQTGRRSSDQNSQLPPSSVTDVLSYYAASDRPDFRSRRTSADKPHVI